MVLASNKMRADTKLDYAVFQLTPTRTRCELLLVSQGITFKLASGLLKPFVSHLRVAEEQIAKGGYSVRLEPPDCASATWFTKGTMERFVRFVSTPQVLERVSTVETELVELEETILNQKNNIADERSAVLAEEAAAKMIPSPTSKIAPSPTSKGNKLMVSMPHQKLIKCGESLDGSESTAEGNAKQRLLRALDARRLMLQKEQGMAFARALAAGFNIEHMDDMVSFSECFGASRLREACLKFIALCKKRQESGLWQEDLDLAAIEAARAGIDVMRATGDVQDMLDEQARRASFPFEGMAIVGENMIKTHTRRGSLEEISSQQPLQGTPNMRSPGTMIDQSSPTWRHNEFEHKNGGSEGITGLVSGHPLVGAWAGHLSPHEAMHPSFYGFARPGMPYPPQAGSPYMQAAYAENSRWHIHPSQYWHGNHNTNGTIDGVERSPHSGPRIVADRDSRGRNFVDRDDQDESPNDMDMEHTSLRKQSLSPRRKGHNSGSNRSRKVVIRNINYITSSAQDQFDAGSNNGADVSGAYSENEESNEGEDNVSENSNVKRVYGDGGNESHASLFLDRRRSNHNASSHHHPVEVESNIERTTGNSSKIYNKGGESMDGMLSLPERGRSSRSGDIYSKMFLEQGVRDNKRNPNAGDHFVFPDSRKNLPERSNGTLDVEFELSGKHNNRYSQEKFLDDSFIVSDQRSSQQKSNLDWKAPLNLTSEMLADRNSVDESKISRQKSQFFEPDDFFMKSEMNKDSVNKPRNATVDYDMQVLAADMIDGSQRSQEQDVINAAGDDVNEHGDVDKEIDSKQITKASDQRSKAKTVQQIQRRQSTMARQGKLTEAQMRAEKLRDYKADLQRRKKEKEDEERKRIEELKRQRQERIAARTSAGTNAVKSPSTNRILQAPPLNASKHSPSTVPQKTLIASLHSVTNGTSLKSHGSQNSIGNRPSRITEISVPSSLSGFQKSTKSPVSGSRSSTLTAVKRTPLGRG